MSLLIEDGKQLIQGGDDLKSEPLGFQYQIGMVSELGGVLLVRRMERTSATEAARAFSGGRDRAIARRTIEGQQDIA